MGCQVSLQSAEIIKLKLGSIPESPVALAGESKEEARKRRKKEDAIDVKSLGISENIPTLSRRVLFERIVIPRLQEMFTLIGKEL